VGETRDMYRVLVEKPEGKRPLGRARCRREDNIKMGCGGMNWIELTQDRGRWLELMNSVINLQVP
jgi:hypothetical protein